MATRSFHSRLHGKDNQNKLVLIGNAVMPIPFHDDVIHLGVVEEQEKWDAVAACDWLVMPSPHESLDGRVGGVGFRPARDRNRGSGSPRGPMPPRSRRLVVSQSGGIRSHPARHRRSNESSAWQTRPTLREDALLLGASGAGLSRAPRASAKAILIPPDLLVCSPGMPAWKATASFDPSRTIIRFARSPRAYLPRPCTSESPPPKPRAFLKSSADASTVCRLGESPGDIRFARCAIGITGFFSTDSSSR